jgi:type II secretory pathway pseudopilin PulG
VTLNHVNGRRRQVLVNGEASASRDAGETLLEVMVSITLMAMAFTIILGGIFTSARTANLNRDRTRASTALQAAAESVLQPVGSNAYRACSTTTDTATSTADTANNLQSQKDQFGPYSPVLPYGTPPGWKVRITRVVYLTNPTPFVNTGGVREPSFPAGGGSGYNQQAATAACYLTLSSTDTPRRDLGLQLLTLVIEKADGTMLDSITVTKRDQRCSTVAVNADYVDQGPC